MIKVGCITLAQSPRDDITYDTIHLLGKEIELVQYGCLDHLTKREVINLKPIPNDYILTSRLRDGFEVRISRGHILNGIQNGINILEKQGVELIMIFCTGDFGCVLKSSIPLIEPKKILISILPQVAILKDIIIITPSVDQMEQVRKQWKKDIPQFNFIALAASPYDIQEDWNKVASKINKTPNSNLVVLDCMGFTVEIRDKLLDKINKNIILPRTILFKMVSELIRC